MSLREEMNSLAREISSSYESRIRGVSQIRRETQSQLRQFDRAHNAMAQQLQADLDRAATARRQDEARRARDRTQVVAHRKSEVNAQRHEVVRAHNAMAQQLQADLDRAATARRQDEAQRARDRTQVVAHRKSEVNAQRHEVVRAHTAMAERQREDLERGPSELIRVEHLRKSEVKTWLERVAAHHAGAQAAWRDLVANMGAKRAGAVAVAEAPPRVAPPPPAVRVAAPAITTEEDAVERVVVGEVTTEFASLSDRVFVYLANHPDGTRLAELEREIGLSRFQAARAVRHLIDEGKTEKREFCYFAI